MGLCGLQSASTHPLITTLATTLEELARITSTVRSGSEHYSKSFISSLRDLVTKAQRGLSKVTKIDQIDRSQILKSLR